MKEMKAPDNKDDLIKYLMDRLDCSEQVLQEADNCITNERAKRIQLKEELYEKNERRKDRNLQEKVHEELEKTLNASIQAKVRAENELKNKVNECRERDMMCAELDFEVLRMRQQMRDFTKKEEEAKVMKGELDDLREEHKKTKEENSKLQEEIEECTAVIKKLDEARYTLNRLLGPNGVLTERERQKFLKQRGDEDYDVGPMEDNNGTMGRNGANAGNASRNMLGSNNDYFYNDQQNKPEGDNEDDFWYGAPKGGAYDQPGPMAGGEYQSYIGGTQGVDPSVLGKSGRKPPSAAKRSMVR